MYKRQILYSGSVNALHFLRHVFGNAGFQNGKVLKNGGKQSVIVAAVILPDILSVQENPPFRWVKKTAYKADQSGFSGAVETDNCLLYTSTVNAAVVRLAEL